MNGSANYTTLTDAQKVQFMLTNPALAKVINYNCDVFSTLKIVRKDEKEDDLTKLLKKPNPFQTQRQFLWMYRFWVMFGSAYMKSESNNIASTNARLFWLEPQKFNWGSSVLNKLDKHILSKKSENDLYKLTIDYTYTDGTKAKIALGDLTVFHDLANGLGNWLKGNSRIDPLYKIILNSESGLDSKNVNLEFSRKYLVSGQYDPSKNLNSPVGMQDIEKEGIVRKLRSKQAVHPVKAQVEIKRFVENLANLKLDESYNEDLSKIGAMYSIPGDVLEAIKGTATYENMEKSTARHIEYSEKPKAMDFLEGICSQFGLDANDYDLIFADNSFMKVFEKDQAEIFKSNAKTMETLVKIGGDANEIAEMLGMNLNFKKNAGQNQ